MLDTMLLTSLCTANGISGQEEAVRELILSEIKPYVDSYHTDALGNLIVYKKGKSKAVHKLMLSAHMDEVGFVVTNITADGYIRFAAVGGIDSRVVPGKHVVIGSNGVNGVIGIKHTHLSTENEKKTVAAIENMYIDIGCTTRQEAESYVSPGDQIAFNSPFEIENDMIKGKAIDDRIGCYILIQLIKSQLEYDMCFTFVVQEEVGLRGAKVAAFSVDPDFALVIEATTALDLTDVPAHKQVCKVGQGAVVGFMDRSTVYDKELYQRAFVCAEKTNSKIQTKQAVAGGNDSGVIHSTRGGVRTLAVSLPCRYLHAPVSMISQEDVFSAEHIVSQLANEICGGTI